MGVLNMLVQLVGIGAGLYLMFTSSFTTGAVLIAVVVGGHFLFTQLSNLLIYLHQKSLPADRLRDFSDMNVRLGLVEIPPAWKAIATGCAVTYMFVGISAIYFFLTR